MLTTMECGTSWGNEMTKKFRFSQRSIRNMDVHPDLVRVCHRALELSEYDFIIVDGGRTIEEQRHYVKTGKSKTMKSRHLDGKAVDFVDVKGTYKFSVMRHIADCFKKAGEELLGLGRIEWGGDWKSFKDTPHIQLSKKYYP